MGGVVGVFGRPMGKTRANEGAFGRSCWCFWASMGRIVGVFGRVWAEWLVFLGDYGQIFGAETCLQGPRICLKLFITGLYIWRLAALTRPAGEFVSGDVHQGLVL